jgi:hypothetical protein
MAPMLVVKPRRMYVGIRWIGDALIGALHDILNLQLLRDPRTDRQKAEQYLALLG